jgi:TRAP-type C4-dicarboxylate transport system permease small subunit
MRRLLEGITASWALLGGLILIAIVLVTVTNAGAFAFDRVARLFGGAVGALPGYEDFVRLAISAAALMLLPYCQYKRGHVAVDLFMARAPRRLQRLLDLLTSALMAGLAAFLAYWMVLGLLETRADGSLSRVLGWPEWPFYLPGVVSLVLWAMVAGHQALTFQGNVPERPAGERPAGERHG